MISSLTAKHASLPLTSSNIIPLYIRQPSLLPLIRLYPLTPRLPLRPPLCPRLHSTTYTHLLPYHTLPTFQPNTFTARTTTPYIPFPSRILSNTPFSLSLHIDIQPLSTPRLFPIPLPSRTHFISTIRYLLIQIIPIPRPSSPTHVQISHPHPFLPQWHPLPTLPPNAATLSTARHNPQLPAPTL